MARYTVPLTSWANIAVDVEVSDDATPEDIVNAAIEAASPSLCNHCSASSNDSLDIGDDWNPIPLTGGEDGYSYTRLDD